MPRHSVDTLRKQRNRKAGRKNLNVWLEAGKTFPANKEGLPSISDQAGLRTPKCVYINALNDSNLR